MFPILAISKHMELLGFIGNSHATWEFGEFNSENC